MERQIMLHTPKNEHPLREIKCYQHTTPEPTRLRYYLAFHLTRPTQAAYLLTSSLSSSSSTS